MQQFQINMLNDERTETNEERSTATFTFQEKESNELQISETNDTVSLDSDDDFNNSPTRTHSSKNWF